MDPSRLTAISLFSHLSDEESIRLASFATESAVAEGTYLVRAGRHSSELIAIEQGTADVIRHGELIASIGAGDVVGAMGLLSDEPRTADVVATSPLRVFTLTHWEIRRMSRETVGRLEAIIEQRRAGNLTH